MGEKATLPRTGRTAVRSHGRRALVIAAACALAMVAAMAGTAMPVRADEPDTAATQTAADVAAPAYGKHVTSNGDGTYTLSMDVTGKSDETTEQQVTPLDIALVLDASGSMGEPSGSGRRVNGHAETRLEALKDSVGRFLDQLAARNQGIENPADRARVALVKYAGTTNTQIGNNDCYYEYRNTTRGNYNCSQVMSGLTSDLSAVKGSVNSLRASGPTLTDAGLQLAQRQLDANARSGAQKMVILYSDGAPGNTGFDTEIANRALYVARKLKAAGTTVYTVGAMAGADVNGRSNENLFMNYASSNYPNATSMNLPGSRAAGTHYLAVSGTMDLQAIFERLVRMVTSGTAYQDVTMRDTLSPYAQFAQPDAANSSARLVIRDAAGTVVDASVVGLSGAQTPTITADPAAKTVSVRFPDGYVLRDGYRYSLEYVIEPTAKAYEDYAANLNAGNDPYGGMQGDEGTGDQSAGKPGFRSNDTASIDYTPRLDGKPQDPVKDTPLPHPVIQVDTARLARFTVGKHWAGVAVDSRPASVLVDVDCTVDGGGSCTGYRDVALAADPADAAKDWQTTVWIPVADTARTFTVTEHAIDGTYAHYDGQRSWTLAAGQSGEWRTTVTNYPTNAQVQLSGIRVGKTVQGTDTDGSFGFTLTAADGQDGLAGFAPVDTTVAGPFTRGERKDGAFDGTASVALPSPDEDGRSYAFTVREREPDNAAAWDWDRDTVDVTVRIATDEDGVPQFNDDGTAKATVTYGYRDGDGDSTDANRDLAAFTNTLKPASELPMTGAGGTTALLWLAVGGGIGALAFLAAGGTAVWRRRHRA